MDKTDIEIVKLLCRFAGKHFTEGAIFTITKWFLIVVIILLVIAIVRNVFGLGIDSTDASPRKRSGMTLYTDYGTGVQYLQVGSALTPRLNPDGSLHTVK